MVPYAVYLSVLVLHVFLAPVILRNNKSKLVYYLIMSIPGLMFFLLCVLKSDAIGIDTQVYREHYIQAATSSSPLDPSFEFLYSVSQFCFSKLGMPFRGFQVFCYLLISAPITFVSIKGTSSPGLMVLTYSSFGFLIFAFSGLRQSIAMSFFLLAVYLLSKRRFLISILLIGAAALFHTSALLCIVIFPFYWLRYYKSYTIPLIITAILLFFIIPDLYQTVWWSQTVTTIYPPIVNYSNYENFALYLLIFSILAVLLHSNVVQERINGVFSRFDRRNLTLAPIDSKNGSQSIKFLNLSTYGFYIGVIAYAIANVNFSGLRLSYPFLTMCSVLIPHSIEHQQSKTLKLFLKGSACIALVAYFIYTSCSGYLNAYPYKFFFQI